MKKVILMSMVGLSFLFGIEQTGYPQESSFGGLKECVEKATDKVSGDECVAKYLKRTMEEKGMKFCNENKDCPRKERPMSREDMQGAMPHKGMNHGNMSKDNAEMCSEGKKCAGKLKEGSEKMDCMKQQQKKHEKCSENEKCKTMKDCKTEKCKKGE